LGGSRGAGVADHESDYDLEWVLSDAAYDARAGRGEPMEIKKHAREGATVLLDMGYTCPAGFTKRLENLAGGRPAMRPLVYSSTNWRSGHGRSPQSPSYQRTRQPPTFRPGSTPT
jgi:hypothetical protein